MGLGRWNHPSCHVHIFLWALSDPAQYKTSNVSLGSNAMKLEITNCRQNRTENGSPQRRPRSQALLSLPPPNPNSVTYENSGGVGSSSVGSPKFAEMMNTVFKAAAIFNAQVNSSMHLRAVAAAASAGAALFHSTPVLDRRRRDSRETRRNYYVKRSRRRRGSYTSFYAEQNMKREFDENDASSSNESSWFNKKRSKGSRKRRGRRDYQFCEDDLDPEFIFQSMCFRNRLFYWSFIRNEDPHFWSSSNYSNNYGRSSSWKYQFSDDSESDSTTELDCSKSDRVALGLSPFGPLKIEDVKDAYRTCAMKWHPDRHQGSSKTAAEERFKLCSAAYQSLCAKLEVN